MDDERRLTLMVDEPEVVGFELTEEGLKRELQDIMYYLRKPDCKVSIARLRLRAVNEAKKMLYAGSKDTEIMAALRAMLRPHRPHNLSN